MFPRSTSSDSRGMRDALRRSTDTSVDHSSVVSEDYQTAPEDEDEEIDIEEDTLDDDDLFDEDEVEVEEDDGDVDDEDDDDEMEEQEVVDYDEEDIEEDVSFRPFGSVPSVAQSLLPSWLNDNEVNTIGRRTHPRDSPAIVQSRDGLRTDAPTKLLSIPFIHEDLIDVTHLATCQTSSSKSGHGVACLFDERSDTFWQSDSGVPHSIMFQFDRRLKISAILIYLSFDEDDSYTPQRIQFRAGTCIADLQESFTYDFDKPQGWHAFLFNDFPGLPGFDKVIPTEAFIFPFLVQLCVLSNHSNGKDAHIRAIRVFSEKM